MKYSVIFISILLLAFRAAVYPQQIQKIKYQGKDIVKNELIIKFKRYAGLSAQSGGTGIRSVILKNKNAFVMKVWSTGAEHWKISTDSIDALIRELSSNPDVEYVEPNYIVHQSTAPSDPNFKNQWAVNGTSPAGIGAMAAWGITTGDSSIVVGVIDSGIDYLHEDLKANIWTNMKETPNNGIDDDHNGYIDDIHGWDFLNNDNDPMDDNHHGTHVSGIIGAKGNNNVGIAGVAWNVKLAALKFLNSQGDGTISMAIQALEYCITNGIKITNCSWGGPVEGNALYDEISKAGQAGVIMVAASGNAGLDNDATPEYPASYDLPNIISVAANSFTGELASFSNYGKTKVDLSAPGVGIFSCAPGNSYMNLDGTSMAAPYVTGAIVLIKSVYPGKTNAEIINLLFSSVDASSAMAGKTTTGGRLNLFKPLSFSGAASVKLSASELNFGGAVINGGNMPQNKLTIYNSSAEYINIDTIRSESGFLISNSSGVFLNMLVNTPLRASQSADIFVKADPKVEKSYDTLITLRFSRGTVSWTEKVRCRLKAFARGTLIASEDVSGNWSKQMSPIIINSPVKVPSGQRLEMEPGVEVIFFNNSGISSGSQDVSSEYNIRAAGTKQDSIYFRSIDPGTSWSGFTFTGRGKYIFEYCNFLNASKSSAGQTEGAGGAIYCAGPDLRIVNSSFHDSHAGRGGAVEFTGSDGIVYIDSSRFTGNDALRGGALDLRGKENWLLNSEFTGNKSSEGIVNIQGASSGIYSSEKAFVYNCSFINNISDNGGSMIDASFVNTIIIKNCLGIRNNISTSGGAIYLNTISKGVVSNCTLFDNAAGGAGAALMAEKVTECVLENSILWNKFGNEIMAVQDSYQKFTASYNSIKNYNTGTGNLSTAPDFADTSSFSLAENSALKDKGNPLEVYNDQDGSRNDPGFKGGNPLAVYPVVIGFGKNGLINSTPKTVPVEFVSFNREIVKVQSWNVSSADFTISGMPAQILPFKSNEIMISFTPKQIKSYSDTLYINTSLASANKIKILLSGVCEEISCIGGEISGELNNTGGTGIYHVINDLLVAKGSALTIGPGVTLLFQPNIKLTIEGDLAVKGSADQKVVFSSESDSSYAGVIIVRPNNTKDIILENLVMRKTLGFNIQSVTHKIIFNNCEFTDNKNLSEVNSPFINSYGSVAQFNNCRFLGNKTVGPVIFSASGKLFVNNCLLSGNISAWAYFLSENSVTNICNSSIFNNKSGAGILIRTNPALGAFKDSCIIVNTVLSDNVNLDAKYPYEISIMSQNMSAPAENLDVKLYLELTNSCIKGGRPKLFVPANSRVSLNSSVETDPGFADQSGNLGPGSACINKGTNSYKNLQFSVTDLACNFRIWNKTIDIGAYEFGSKKYFPIPEKPVLDYPKDTAAIAKDVTFKWKQVPGALTYCIQVSSTNTFEARTTDSTLTDTLKIMSLSSGSKYYWRVQAKNTTALGQWSDVWSFSTFIAAPASTPVLNKPSNSAVNQPISLTLYWRKLKTSEKYHLQVSPKFDFSSLLVNDTTLTDTLKQLSGLLNINSAYFWRVRGINQGGKSPWSEEWTFTTIPPVPQTPLLAKPANDSKENALPVKFSWNAIRYTDKYRLIVSEDDKFTKIKAADSTVNDTLKEVKTLKEGMKYFWKVSSRNAAGESPGSEVWNFTTLLNAPDSLDTSVISWDKLVLSWKDRSNGESGFIIERKQWEDFIALDTVGANQTTYTDSTVSLRSSYQYRVRSYTPYVLSAYSNVASATITAVDELSLIPKEYSLLQNYPNPFNPATVIKYGLPAESRVKLIIYNSLGEMVGEYINEIQSAGFHQINFNAGRISSGVYYYLLEARATDSSRDYRKVRKMLIVK